MRALGLVHGVLLFFAFCLAAPVAVKAETRAAAQQKKAARKKKAKKRPVKAKVAAPPAAADVVIDRATVEGASLEANEPSSTKDTKDTKAVKGTRGPSAAEAAGATASDDAATEAAISGGDSQVPSAPSVGDDADGAEAPDAPVLEREVAPLACLREDATPEGTPIRGVQKKDFLKKHRFELAGFGGLYASDTLSSSYTFGGALTFFPGEEFGLEVMATFLPMEYRLEETITSFDLERRFSPSRSLAILGGLVYSPIHAKFKVTEQSILHGDIFFVGGAGRTDHDSIQGLTWQVGFGMDLYLKQFLSLRIDVRDLIHGQEIFGHAAITNNIVWLVGLGLWLG